MSDLAQRIREARKRLGLSQAKFAKLVKASQGSVSKWESGRERPSTDSLLEITLHTGQSLSDLWLGDDSRENLFNLNLAFISVIGQIDPGVFVESLFWDVGDTFHVPVPFHLSDLEMVGFRIIGDDFGTRFPADSVVFIIKSQVYDLGLCENDIVAVKSRKFGLMEMSLRRYSFYKGEVWLSSISQTPDGQGAIRERYAADDQELSIEIYGLVVGSVRPEVMSNREFHAKPQPPKPVRSRD